MAALVGISQGHFLRGKTMENQTQHDVTLCIKMSDWLLDSLQVIADGSAMDIEALVSQMLHSHVAMLETQAFELAAMEHLFGPLNATADSADELHLN
jgi:hypothetical protein